MLTCADLRRHFRPFFLHPTTQQPLPSKRYYDLASWLTTQLTFSFAAAPFMLLGFNDSLTAWKRVYFYAIVGTFSLLAVFMTPGVKKNLRKALEKRQRAFAVPVGEKREEEKKGGEDMVRSPSSSDENGGPVGLGVSDDIERDLDEAVGELKAEVERAVRQRRTGATTLRRG